MSEAEEAYGLWYLLQKLSALLLQRYESAFMDFEGEQSNCSGRYGVDDGNIPPEQGF